MIVQWVKLLSSEPISESGQVVRQTAWLPGRTLVAKWLRGACNERKLVQARGTGAVEGASSATKVKTQ